MTPRSFIMSLAIGGGIFGGLIGSNWEALFLSIIIQCFGHECAARLGQYDDLLARRRV